ncbi:carbamoyl-phosphate synthase large subunit [Candidatus Methanoperedens nitroreducens]|uniref:Carbamoyl phosphate synthase large chain n=1 Tax=Candidatus Methanoperedens nitratireducens TaxID=1392998 RepID=A0A062UZL2_9EURY|nr:carbamoyl-phosphate synthase large subunit [Candidatus Methanoperedens nitroreducens]KCZ70607.1 carbamoyl-phosphate synthase large subunit [Candidatus Methanoperedens nitroreducens]MDJ1420462.1 carbamoyl-phosphate synthase large subunit [Candidatus Methanoperedens sp.]
MPKRPDIKKILLIGSGPIMIGQAAEFDFSGSQACRSLREEGIKVVLVNSNPATIMTDTDMADAIYIEPLEPEIVAKIIERERPDGVIAGLGGQTGLNITAELAEMGILEKFGVELLGTPLAAIKDSEDRDLFKKKMLSIGEKVPRSKAVNTLEEAEALIEELGLPLIIRPAYTLGGAGGGIARTREELLEITQRGLERSRIHQVLIEESIIGWKEFEYEVMRDRNDTCIVICNMENIDPMGIHTGESIVVTPSQTLSDADHQRLRSASIKIIRALGIEGGCNIQFAVRGDEVRIVEVNPRVSRSSALASKATGYPIARVSAKIAIGMTLDEITNDITKKTPASFEPTIDYTVVKIPRWPFDKFVTADKHLTTAMKSTGEVMAIGRTIEEALQKAVRSLEADMYFGYKEWSDDEIMQIMRHPTHERLFVIYHALRKGMSIDEISRITDIDPFFCQKIQNIIDTEDSIKEDLCVDNLLEAKHMGLSDERIAFLCGRTREEINDMRRQHGIIPTYKMVDTCAAEFAAATPYYYSTYEDHCEAAPSDKKKVLIIGSGPIRIGQGIEFDYCTVHAVTALREEGIETHIINNNPETVSTDYDTSDKLFFEPLTLEDVMNVIDRERHFGVMVQFGGQTSVNLAIPLRKELDRRVDLNTVILGTTPDDMDIAEDRGRFNSMMKKLGIPQPEAGCATNYSEAFSEAKRIGYPVLVRPSYVLGGRAMEIVYDERDLERYLREAVRVSNEHPVLIDDFLDNAVEIDVDAICDGSDVLIGAIMEHIEEAGIHSGDSACVIPPQSLKPEILATVRDYVQKIAISLHVVGIINIQMATKNGVVYVLEANPRSSRTIPFVSKAVGLPLAKIAAKVMAGHTLKELGYAGDPVTSHVSVKEVLLPFDKLPGADPVLGPEMKSTGEVMGIDYDFGRAFFKAEWAADNILPLSGTVFMSIRDDDKPLIVGVAKKMQDAGLRLIGTRGTAGFLEKNGIKMDVVNKVSEGNPNIVDLIHRKEVDLIINTPRSKQTVKDGFQIRRAAVDFSIPYITTIQAALAAADAIVAMKKGNITIKSIGEYHAGA